MDANSGLLISGAKRDSRNDSARLGTGLRANMNSASCEAVLTRLVDAIGVLVVVIGMNSIGL